MSIGTVASTISWRIGASSHLRIHSTRPSVRRSSTIPMLSFRTESPFASRRGSLSQPALDSASVDILHNSRPTLGTFSAVHRDLKPPIRYSAGLDLPNQQTSAVYRLAPLLVLALFLLGPPLTAEAQPKEEVCGPAPANDGLMERAIDVLGIDTTRILHFGAGEYVVQSFQSERTYPPFFALVRQSEIWYDPATGVQRTRSEFVYPGFGPSEMPDILNDDRSAFVDRDGTLIPAPGSMGAQALHPMNPWAVVPSFRDAELTEE